MDPVILLLGVAGASAVSAYRSRRDANDLRRHRDAIIKAQLAEAERKRKANAELDRLMINTAEAVRRERGF